MRGLKGSGSRITGVLPARRNSCQSTPIAQLRHRASPSGSVASLCAHTGHADFEDAFVALAFPDAIALPARLEEAA